MNLFFLITYVTAQNLSPKPGYIVGIDSPLQFCLIIPQNFGDDIAANDATGISGCWGNVTGASPTKQLPEGFITSAV
jgi:hypothetical protein